MNRRFWFLVVGDWDYECYQSRLKPEVFAIYDTHKKRYTVTDDCIRDVKKNPEAYEWVNV